MPGLQVVDLSPLPRTETTPLEKTLAGFTKRNRENQIEQQETDALSDIYKQYQNDGMQLQNAIMAIQTRPGISPTTRVNSVNQLLSFQKHNEELKEKAKKKQEEDQKKLNNRKIVTDIAEKRGLPPEEATAYEDKPELYERTTRPPKESKDKTEDKRKVENEEKVRGFESALHRLDRMEQIRKKENIGRGSAVTGFFGGETAKDRAEYSRLGKSLISFASTIPIRNQIEFETLAHDLYDPSKTLSEMDGIIKAMRRILTDSINEVNPQYNQANQSNPLQQTIKEKPPLSSFKR